MQRSNDRRKLARQPRDSKQRLPAKLKSSGSKRLLAKLIY